ncbi:hypothetical protein H4R26_000965, partial [Coemansia thaxteri]
MFVSTYLRQAKVYSLESFHVVFEISSVAESLSCVEIYYGYAAVLRGRNVVEVHRWKEQTLAARIVIEDACVCSIRLCAEGKLVVATTDWSLLIFDVEKAELRQK